MKKVHITAASGTSQVILGGSMGMLQSFTDAKRTVIITDRNVHQHHGHGFPQTELIIIEPGEDAKTLDSARAIYERFVELELDRGALVVGIGGGVVTDLTGFAAATFLRGVKFGFVATTLLAQVDASIGGKNGVNLNHYKNMVGTFAQPAFVLLDYDLLGTLPVVELRSGLAEVVKAAAIGDGELFELLERRRDEILALDRQAIGMMVEAAVAVKARIVNEDERESSTRRLLNLGHTFGHALERTVGVTHGEAVSVGMVVAARISQARGMLEARDTERLEALLTGFGLPTRIAVDGAAVFDAMKRDKKRDGDEINFVLLEQLGGAVVEPIGLKDLEQVIHDLC